MPALPTTVSELVDAVERGEEFTYRFFWKPTPDDRIDNPCLSQWWPCRFVVDGQTYTSAEQWMMAEKARLFEDDYVLEKILSATDPYTIMQLGREVRNYEAKHWEAVRFARVVQGNLAKFGDDPALRAFLLSTAGEVLVEASPRDTIWGIGLGADNPRAGDPRLWRGTNLLGFALMQARDAL